MIAIRSCAGDCKQGRHPCPHVEACSGVELHTDLQRVELANGQTVQLAPPAAPAACGPRGRLRAFGRAVAAGAALALLITAATYTPNARAAEAAAP